VMGQASVVQI